MKKLLTFSLFLLLAFASKAQTDTKFYELRTYYCNEGRLHDLLARFQKHTIALFQKHGMGVVGFWVPMDNKENKLIYVLSYPNKAARDASWKSFSDDPVWKTALANSIKEGEIISKVESVFLKTTDFSPNNFTSVGDRVFELRIYKATPTHLPNLLERFRGNTLRLFEKHGMTNLVYWTVPEKEAGSEDMLYYLLAHKTKEAGLAEFKAFGADPDWIAVRKASEEKAGGSLTVNVKSEYLVPVDFSVWK